jgi:hypothetical protein
MVIKKESIEPHIGTSFAIPGSAWYDSMQKRKGVGAANTNPIYSKWVHSTNQEDMGYSTIYFHWNIAHKPYRGLRTKCCILDF